MDASQVTDEMVEAVEREVGMGCNAWDCVSPKEIIAAAISLVESKPKP